MSHNLYKRIIIFLLNIYNKKYTQNEYLLCERVTFVTLSSLFNIPSFVLLKFKHLFYFIFNIISIIIIIIKMSLIRTQLTCTDE
jgi:hypothetical protein